MLVGFQGVGPDKLKRIATILAILVVIYEIVYAVWAANNLALILDMVADDRYVSVQFWRLVFPFLNIFSSSMTLLLLYNNLRINRFYPYTLHCIIVVIGIILGLVWIVWLALDIVDCSNVVYCDGDGNGPLGYDLALWIAGVAQIIMFLINILFLYFNFDMKQKVQTRNLLDLAANPNRQPIPGDTEAALRGAAFYPTNFISEEYGSQYTNDKSREMRLDLNLPYSMYEETGLPDVRSVNTEDLKDKKQ